MKRNLVITLLFLLCGAGTAKAQGAQVEFVAKKFPFVHTERNELVIDSVLKNLFEKMYLQRSVNNQRIRFLQIGDSHIQADFLSAQIRTNLQKDFGNAGRGLVVPIRLAGSNEPFNYKITSNVKCYGKRCVYVNDSLDYGIGGYVVETKVDTARFYIHTFNYPPLNYAFSKVTMFFGQDSLYRIIAEDTAGNILGIFETGSSHVRNTATLKLPSITNDLALRIEQSDSTQRDVLLYGFNLENDSTGVVYHSVGVNGAEAFQYVNAKYFAEQTIALLPDVIIISLGTNEAQRRPFDKALTEARLDSLVKQLKQYNPGTPVILTTPPDSYYHRKYYNPAVAAYHTMAVDYAKRNNLAVWDLFSIAGGYKSAYQWKKYGLLRRDGIHFTRAGYEMQGNLLYEALIKSYNRYVEHRP